MHDYLEETRKNMEADNLAGEFEEHEDEIRELIYDRNDSDPVKDLIRNSSVTNFFYSLGVEISGYLTGCSLRGESVAMACHKVRRALHLKKGEFDEKIEELVENATYGGELRIYFNAMFDRLISKDPENDFKSIRFHGNVVVAIADSRNGSGHHVRIPLDITFPFRRENLFVDSQVHYSYANEVCGMTNDWCDSTKWETGMIPFTGSVRKSRMAEYKKQEAAYEQTFRSGKCTFGDMNYKRHRDVRYSNEYPAGCRCQHEHRRAAQNHRLAADGVRQRTVKQAGHRERQQVHADQLLQRHRGGVEVDRHLGERRKHGVDRERPDHAQPRQNGQQNPLRGQCGTILFGHRSGPAPHAGAQLQRLALAAGVNRVAAVHREL